MARRPRHLNVVENVDTASQNGSIFPVDRSAKPTLSLYVVQSTATEADGRCFFHRLFDVRRILKTKALVGAARFERPTTLRPRHRNKASRAARKVHVNKEFCRSRLHRRTANVARIVAVQFLKIQQARSVPQLLWRGRFTLPNQRD